MISKTQQAIKYMLDNSCSVAEAARQCSVSKAAIYKSIRKHSRAYVRVTINPELLSQSYQYLALHSIESIDQLIDLALTNYVLGDGDRK